MSKEKIMLRGMFWVSACLLIVIALIATLTLSACTQQKSKEPESSSSEYTQTVIELPKGAYTVTSIEKTNSGKLWMVSARDVNSESGVPSFSLWELNDDSSWKEEVNISELLVLDGQDFVCASSITKDDKVLCLVSNWEGYTSEIRFYLVDLELESGYSELNVDVSEFVRENEEVSLGTLNPQLWSLKNGQFLVKNHINAFYVLDIPSGTIKPVSFEGNSIWWRFLDIAELGETLYALYEDSADGYSTKLTTLDIAAGSFNDVESEELVSLLDEYGVGGSFRIFPTMKADSDPVEKITLCLRGGIISYSNGEARVIANAEDTIMADASTDILGHAFASEDDFFLICWEPTNPDKTFLYKYEKTAGL